MNKDMLYYIWMSRVFDYGDYKIKEILKQSSPKQFFRDKNKEKNFEFLTKKRLNKIKNTTLEDCEYVVEQCNNKHINIVCIDDELYPDKLKNIDAPPPVLYYAGDLNILKGRCVGFVGTRKSSDYANNVTKSVASSIAGRDIVVVSGCADGIDRASHSGALETGKTVAVLGTSLDKDYPYNSAPLKRLIVRKGGVVLSEYPPGTKTAPWLFPIRNRIIAGLSDIIVITQAPKKSGAVITANLAIEQGKDVFCLPPADITSPKYEGVKPLIREGARVLLGSEDIFDYYLIDSMPANKNANLNKNIEKLSKEALMVYDILDQSMELDEIASVLNMKANVLLRALTELEILNMIEKIGSTCRKKVKI